MQIIATAIKQHHKNTSSPSSNDAMKLIVALNVEKELSDCRNVLFTIWYILDQERIKDVNRSFQAFKGKNLSRIER